MYFIYNVLYAFDKYIYYGIITGGELVKANRDIQIYNEKKDYWRSD